MIDDMIKLPESKMRIRFHDCDPYNHLNNSRYIDYIMAARGDQLMDHYGFDMYVLAQEKGVSWVSAQTQISYLAPALIMEEVTIQTQLIAYTHKSLLMEGLMWNTDKTHLKAFMWVKLVHFNIRLQKSHVHSEELMHFFAQIVNPQVNMVQFEERFQILKNINNKSL